MPTYITQWDPTRNALVETVITDHAVATDIVALVVLTDTLITPAFAEPVNSTPVSATGTPTVVLF